MAWACKPARSIAENREGGRTAPFFVPADLEDNAPVARLGAPHTPMPYNDRLELEVIPSQDRIVDAVRALL